MWREIKKKHPGKKPKLKKDEQQIMAIVCYSENLHSNP